MLGQPRAARARHGLPADRLPGLQAAGPPAPARGGAATGGEVPGRGHHPDRARPERRADVRDEHPQLHPPRGDRPPRLRVGDAEARLRTTTSSRRSARSTASRSRPRACARSCGSSPRSASTRPPGGASSSRRPARCCASPARPRQALGCAQRARAPSTTADAMSISFRLLARACSRSMSKAASSSTEWRSMSRCPSARSVGAGARTRPRGRGTRRSGAARCRSALRVDRHRRRRCRRRCRASTPPRRSPRPARGSAAITGQARLLDDLLDQPSACGALLRGRERTSGRSRAVTAPAPPPEPRVRSPRARARPRSTTSEAIVAARPRSGRAMLVADMTSGSWTHQVSRPSTGGDPRGGRPSTVGRLAPASSVRRLGDRPSLSRWRELRSRGQRRSRSGRAGARPRPATAARSRTRRVTDLRMLATVLLANDLRLARSTRLTIQLEAERRAASAAAVVTGRIHVRQPPAVCP